MRILIIAISLSLFAVAAAGKTSPSAKLALLPNGMLAGHVYINDAVGVSLAYPSDWTADADPKGRIDFDPGHPDGPANQCSKILLLLTAPNKVEGRFSSEAALIAIDPDCLSRVDFPQTTSPMELNKVADVIIKRFKNSLFFSPYHVTISEGFQERHIVIVFTGGMIINAIEGHPAPAKEPLEVSTSFSLAQSKGFWVAWACIADEPSAEELKRARLHFTDHPSQ